jgi:hypothetical protein
MKYDDLIACCNRLHDAGIPSSSSYDDDGITRHDGHHYGTKVAMEWMLGHELTDVETSCLALGRCYGPTPVLTDEERKAILDRLWPNGNHCGEWLEWWLLAAMLKYELVASC